MVVPAVAGEVLRWGAPAPESLGEDESESEVTVRLGRLVRVSGCIHLSS